jgi:phage repressor protein C with HTH and peptisase S24 domain
MIALDAAHDRREAGEGRLDDLSHETVWAAIEAVARMRGLSLSALAVKAGLDATAFNRSKRRGPVGRAHWPSMETIAKVLVAAEVDFPTFAALAAGQGAKPQVDIPVVPYALIDDPDLFDAEGRPRPSRKWDYTPFPGAVDALFGVLIEGDSHSPLYHEGDVILVAPGHALKRGDKVFLKTRPDGFMLGSFFKRSKTTVDIHGFTQKGGSPIKVPHETIMWTGRIVWASQ